MAKMCLESLYPCDHYCPMLAVVCSRSVFRSVGLDDYVTHAHLALYREQRLLSYRQSSKLRKIMNSPIIDPLADPVSRVMGPDNQ